MFIIVIGIAEKREYLRFAEMADSEINVLVIIILRGGRGVTEGIRVAESRHTSFFNKKLRTC